MSLVRLHNKEGADVYVNPDHVEMVSNALLAEGEGSVLCVNGRLVYVKENLGTAAYIIHSGIHKASPNNSED